MLLTCTVSPFQLERVLTCERFMEWTHPDQMPLTYVKVKVPRFKLEETYNLSNVLTSMGVKDAFNQMTCDFSGETHGTLPGL